MDETRGAIQEALSVVKKWNLVWSPRSWIIDYAQAVMSALEHLFPAYEQLQKRVLQEGEPIDVYLADIRRQQIRKPRVCYTCDEPGHLAKHCAVGKETAQQGNGQGEASAPDAPPQCHRRSDRNDPEQLKIDESDFTAVFDDVKWTMEWKWENGEPTMANQCSEYAVPNDCREIFDDEVSQWISNGWLEKFNPHIHDKADGVIPLMAAWQPNKPKKVRPVMDYRKLNTFIKNNPKIDVAVCQEKLWAWRKRDNQASILDLRKAYLQIHRSEQLQRFQLVKFKGQLYVMKRMGFGLNDIWVDESVVSAEEVRRLLSKYGLETKEPVPLTNSRVLGLRVIKNPDNQYKWYRDGVVPILQEIPTKCELFSVFGKLVGHYPVAGWLRPACSYLKRQTNEIGWDEEIPVPVREFAKEVMNRISQHDPVTGRWSVSNVSEGVVWCVASSLAVGFCLEIDGSIVEDATWLRKVDGSHINVAELEAVIKGLNIALRYVVMFCI
ncbi:uncharacterized protein [Watersipora subatra]|uniref:uncharacterized protein n=1 Tax=Watersipora subatra TaxID=2589382 RepID=UPI00355BE568